MYKFITNDNVSYEIINTTTFEPVKLDIIPTKLFNNDIFNLPNNIVQSTIRQNKYIAGILILNKTYGKEGKKFLYLCEPDDKRLPLFLIPYVIPVSFNKSLNNLYITFEFTNWDHKYPYGIITQNLGPVNDISNFYEYMMYSKKLNVSIHNFTKITSDIINKNTNIINDIINKYNISIIDDSVITIDASNSIDLDDGISIKDNIISVYIANVPIIIEYLQLWESFTNRISNIYLPNKKYNMLPAILGQICSLNKGTLRICLKIDFNIDTNETNISNCAVKIHNNYTYFDESLNNNDTYNKIKNIYKNKNSSQIIELLMIKTNTTCAEYMKKYKNGIYKIITHSEKLSNSSYELYNDTCNYLTVTSPIRRLIDILNIYKLSDNEKIFKFNYNAEQFYLNWINELKYINLTSKNIRKVQSKCTILNICVNNNHCIYKGKVFDKITIKNMFKYQVYIQELKIYSKIYCDKELDENLEYNFKIYVFQTESNLKNKIKLDIVIT